MSELKSAPGSSRWPVTTYIQAKQVRIVNEDPSRRAWATSIFDIGTGTKLLDVYRAWVVVDGHVYEVTRQSPLASDYEGPALLERAVSYAKFIEHGEVNH